LGKKQIVDVKTATEGINRPAVFSKIPSACPHLLTGEERQYITDIPKRGERRRSTESNLNPNYLKLPPPPTSIPTAINTNPPVSALPKNLPQRCCSPLLHSRAELDNIIKEAAGKRLSKK